MEESKMSDSFDQLNNVTSATLVEDLEQLLDSGYAELIRTCMENNNNNDNQ